MVHLLFHNTTWIKAKGKNRFNGHLSYLWLTLCASAAGIRDRCGQHCAPEIAVVNTVHQRSLWSTLCTRDRCGQHCAPEIFVVNTVHQRSLWSTLCTRDRCDQHCASEIVVVNTVTAEIVVVNPVTSEVVVVNTVQLQLAWRRAVHWGDTESAPVPMLPASPSETLRMLCVVILIQTFCSSVAVWLH